MSEQEVRAFPRLSKLVLHNFLHFEHLELNFDKFTSISGKSRSAEALTSIVEGFKFVFNSSELQLSKLEPTDGDGNDPTYVEAHIINLIGEDATVFNKAIIDHKVCYFIDQDEAQQENYLKKLKEAQILSPTLFLDLQRVAKVAALSDKKRASLVEFFCGSQQGKIVHNQLLSQINSLKLRLDASVKSQKELTTEKNKLKKNVEATAERAQLTNALNSDKAQLDLFKLFHNNQFLEVADGKIEAQRLILDELKLKQAENVEEMESNAQRELRMRDEQGKLEAKLEKMLEDHQDVQLVLNSALEEGKAMKEQEAIKEEIQEKLASYQTMIDDAIKEIERLQGLTGHPHHDEYLQLKETFELANDDDLSRILDLKEILGEGDDAMHEIERITTSSADVQTAIDEQTQMIDQLKEKRDAAVLKKSEIEEQMKQVDDQQRELHRLETIIIKAENQKIPRQMNIFELKKKFPRQVVGRITEMWTVAENKGAAEEKLVRGRLGKFTEAIVVDTPETVERCIEFLKVKQLAPIDEVFIPLSEIPKPMDTKSFLPDGALPFGEVIEDLVETTSDDAKMVLMHCLGNAIVCKSLEEAEKMLEWEGCKKLDVMSSDGAVCFTKEGTIQRHVVDDAVEVFDLKELRKQKLERKLKLVKDKAEVGLKVGQLVPLKREISQLDGRIRELEMSVKGAREDFEFSEQNLAEQKEKLRAAEEDESRPETKKILEELQTEVDRKEAEHFQAFCTAAGVESIKKYLEASDELEIVDMRIKAKQNAVELWKKAMVAVQSMVNFPTRKSDVKKVKKMQMEMKKKEAEIRKQIHEICEQEKVLSGQVEMVQQHKEADRELAQQIIEAFEKVYDDVHGVQMCCKENFEILTKNFMEANSIALDRGTMMDFMMPPADDPEDFHPRDQLKLLEINFDKLRRDLKENGDVPSKTFELVKKISKLEESVSKVGGKIGEKADEQCVRRLIKDIKAVNGTINAFRTRIDEITRKFQEVKQERKQRFVDCVKVVNEGIAEFCRFVFNGMVVGSLDVAVGDEPYLEDLAFTWGTAEQPGHKITEFEANHAAALAFLFGVVKFQQQRLVILDDAAKKIFESLESFFTSQNGLQVVSLTSKISDDSAHYNIFIKSGVFSVTRDR